MKKVDYIIVGQGIAGTLLSWFLLKRNKRVLVVDQFNSSSSSQVAAGIFNPITGKRFVKTWMAEDIFPFAESTYQQLEEELKCKFYHPMSIVRRINDSLEKKEFEKKRKRPEYVEYLGKDWNSDTDESVMIYHGGYVDFVALLQAYRDKLRAENLILETHFTFLHLTLGRNEIAWKDYNPDKIIFCEGHQVMNNPFFMDFPFTSSKGEMLTIKTDKLPQDQLINAGIFILPIGNKLFRVGATYNWEDRTETPTEGAKKELVLKLVEVIGNDFEIIDHKAGIRPTVKDRQPIIGLHPEFNFMGVFNGLGTKGASLGPYFANQFVEFMEDETPLNSEVDIKRFL